MLAAAERLIEAAIDHGRLPGAALGVVDLSGARAISVCGAAQWDPEEIALTPEMWFDLASLTKVMVTVPGVLRLVEAGEADLEDRLGRFLPEAVPPVGRLTLRQLLTHQAGFEPFIAFQDWSDDPAALRDVLVRHPWALGPPIYSDIGYILLGLILERVHGRRLDELPLGEGLAFRPDPAKSVATEDCPWRGAVVRGVVHDERAYALGGAAGHAGLFGTVDGVLDFARALLAGEALSPAALIEMRRPHGDGQSAAAVWRMRGVSASSSGPGASAKNICRPATASAGRTATKRTMMPIPPSHCVMQRQNRRPRLKPPHSFSWKIVAPVVVRPDMLSKSASRPDRPWAA